MKYEKPELRELASAVALVLGPPPGCEDGSCDDGETPEGLALGLDD